MKLFRNQKAQEPQKNAVVDDSGKVVVCPECGYAYVDCIGTDKYCSQCGASLEKNSITNFEKIKAMTVDELADFICGIYDEEEDAAKFINGITIPYYTEDDIKEWLESEVSTDE